VNYKNVAVNSAVNYIINRAVNRIINHAMNHVTLFSFSFSIVRNIKTTLKWLDSCVTKQAPIASHTTKIIVTFVTSHFDTVWYYKNPIPLNYHIFWLRDNTKYHFSKLVTLQKLNYHYNIAPSKYILLIIFVWRLIEIYFSTFFTFWIF